MPKVAQWCQDDPQSVIPQSLHCLGGGGLVVFPTEATYIVAACGSDRNAVERLANSSPGLTIAVRGGHEAIGWVPNMSKAGWRLANRGWPGPVALGFRSASGNGFQGCLATAVRDLLGERLWLRSPSHAALYQTLVNFPGPVLFHELSSADGRPIITAEEAAKYTECDLVITDGTTYFGEPASLVEINGSTWQLNHKGVVGENELLQWTSCQIVLVCTGNTCRSPMAEALCKKLLADKLVCTPPELPSKGYLVQSAGVGAIPGVPPSPEAVEAVKAWDADLSAHQSQPLTAAMLTGADYVLTMTHSHLQTLSGHGMNTFSAPQLLSPDGDDVTDPIGGEQDVYRACAEQIHQHLQQRVDEFLQG